MKRYGRSEDAAAAALTIGAIGFLGILVLILVFAASVGIPSLFVWLGNYGLHVVAGFAMLGFKKTIAVAAIIAAARALLLPGAVKVKT